MWNGVWNKLKTFFHIPTGIFKFCHHHNYMDASMCVHHYHCSTATVPHRYVNTYFHHCHPFFGHHHTFKFQVILWPPPNNFFFLSFLIFTVCISYLNWNLLFPSFFSLLLSFQAFHMTWYFFSFFHFFTCLLRFGHTFYLSKKSMLWKKIWIQVVPNKFTKLVYVGHHIAWHVQALPFIGKMIYII